MPTPEQTPTDPQPDNASSTPSQESENDATINPEPDSAPDAAPVSPSTIPSSTPENLGDGSGIRGGYGDASQTNGLEGGPDQPLTDTELTGS
jgi:hypothetical protein